MSDSSGERGAGADDSQSRAGTITELLNAPDSSEADANDEANDVDQLTGASAPANGEGEFDPQTDPSAALDESESLIGAWLGSDQERLPLLSIAWLGSDQPDPPDDRRFDDPIINIGLPVAIAPIAIAVSTVIAAFAGTKPTGHFLADIVLTAGFAGIVTWLAGAVREPRVVALAAVLAFFFSGFQLPVTLLAGVGLAGAFMLMWRRFDRGSRIAVQTVIGALVVHAALGLPSIRFVGSASLLAGLITAPIVVTGFSTLASDQKGWLRAAAIRATIYAAVATVLLGVAGLLALRPALDGIDQAEAGIDALEAGDQPAAVSLLESAQQKFETAEARLGGILALPSRIVPVLAHNSRALETAVTQGRNLAASAVQTATTADVDRIRGENGTIDLAVVDEVNGALSNANEVLSYAQESIRSARSPWLLPPLDSRLATVETELNDVVADIDLANHATAVMPGILGADGARTYLILFMQPAEAREFGGFVGAYGLLRAVDGEVFLLESGSIDRDFGTGTAEFTEPGLFPQPYFEKRPHVFPQNLSGIPDLTTIAAAAADLAPQWRQDPGFEIDGVMTIDPVALAGFLELTGPVRLEGRADPIDASNVADFLMRDQYVEFDGEADRDLRQDALRDLAATAFSSLLSIEIPGPERLGAVFGPLARTDRIAFTTFDDFENDFLRRVLLDADLPIVSEEIQMVGWYEESGIAGKIDAYSTRTLNYEVTVDPSTGVTDGQLTINYRNDAPANAGEYVLGLISQPDLSGDKALPLGTNIINSALYTRASVSEAAVTPAGTLLTDEALPALTYENLAFSFEIPLASQRAISLKLKDQVEPGRFDLLVAAQTSAVTGDYSVTVRPIEGWRIVGDDVAADGSWTSAGPLDFHQAISVEFEPS